MNQTTELELLDCKTNFDFTSESIITVEEKSTMNEQAVFYLLNEILKKKKELHDPRHRVIKFYPEIRDLLIVKHGLFFSAKTLEKKFHYLKRHFDVLCQTTNREQISWPFFDQMMEIFAEELAIEDAPTMASLYPDLPLPKSALPIPQDMKEESVPNSFLEEELKPANKSAQDDTKETIWNHAVVLDFLNECVAKKDAFWDPQMRRRDILLEIQDRLKAKGYTFQLETLDRKLRNLKTCYHGTIQWMRKKAIPKNRPHRWPYFVQMHELYHGFKEQKIAHKKTGRKPSSRYESVIRRKSVRKLRSRFKNEEQNLSKNTNCDDQPTTSSTKIRASRPIPDSFQEFHLSAPDDSQYSSFKIEDKSDETCDDNSMEFDWLEQEDESKTDEKFEPNRDTETSVDDITDDLQFAQKLIALEERRTVATEQLLEQLIDSNRIRQKKLVFNRVKLSYLKTRTKLKQFFND